MRSPCAQLLVVVSSHCSLHLAVVVTPSTPVVSGWRFARASHSHTFFWVVRSSVSSLGVAVSRVCRHLFAWEMRTGAHSCTFSTLHFFFLFLNFLSSFFRSFFCRRCDPQSQEPRQRVVAVVVPPAHLHVCWKTSSPTGVRRRALKPTSTVKKIGGIRNLARKVQMLVVTITLYRAGSFKFKKRVQACGRTNLRIWARVHFPYRCSRWCPCRARPGSLFEEDEDHHDAWLPSFLDEQGVWSHECA